MGSQFKEMEIKKSIQKKI